jgi:hypothetical protein
MVDPVSSLRIVSRDNPSTVADPTKGLRPQTIKRWPKARTGRYPMPKWQAK